MKITNKTPLDEFEKLLKKNKYDTFDKELLKSPKYMPADNLKKTIFNSSEASYNYIIDLTYRSLLQDACEKREADLKKEKKNLKELKNDCNESDGHFTGQLAWLAELDALEPIIAKGIKHGWNTTKHKPVFKTLEKS